MPVYEYEHLQDPCVMGKIFEVRHALNEPPRIRCPECGGPVKKLISRASIRSPKTDSELRDRGFTKLVRRDDGVYENVTARDRESRYVVRDKPETMPDFKKTIRD